jgi:hypothetical protein
VEDPTMREGEPSVLEIRSHFDQSTVTQYLGLPNVWKEMAVIPPFLMLMQGKQMCPIP